MNNHISITCADKRELSASFHAATSTEGTKKSFIIFNSALGIKKEFYTHFISYLNSLGHPVLSWDARGIGASVHPEGVKNDQAKMRDWGQLDLEAVIKYVTNAKLARFDDITIMGHSAGGHLIGLAPSIVKIKEIILISSGTCSWQLYPIKELPKIAFSWLALVPLAVKFYGYAPGNIGIGHDLPKGVIMDWRNWSLKRDYLFSDPSIGEHFYSKIKARIQAVGFSDDSGFSPPKTMQDLLAHFPESLTSLNTYSPNDLNKKKIGHFSFFKKKNSALWERVIAPLL
jgi:predicted alpha/beta hydrolase